MSKTLADLSENEFNQMLENMSHLEYDALTSEEFFSILNAMDTADEIHLKGHIDKGHFVFDEPSPLPVKGNILQLGAKRIIIDLLQPELI